METNTCNLNTKRVGIANKEGKYPTWGFNCWGATLFVLNQRDTLYWVDVDEMDDFLEYETVTIDKDDLQIGDILVLRTKGGTLMHTATYFQKGKWFHKMGSNQSKVSSLKYVLKEYNYNAEYRRLK